jgi:rRNA-processing protein FCF1
VDGLARQLWYPDWSSSVAARTRSTSKSPRSKAHQSRQATERVRSAILKHEPAIAATNDAQFTPTHARGISCVTMQRKKQVGRVLLSIRNPNQLNPNPSGYGTLIP